MKSCTTRTAAVQTESDVSASERVHVSPCALNILGYRVLRAFGRLQSVCYEIRRPSSSEKMQGGREGREEGGGGKARTSRQKREFRKVHKNPEAK